MTAKKAARAHGRRSTVPPASESRIKVARDPESEDKVVTLRVTPDCDSLYDSAIDWQRLRLVRIVADDEVVTLNPSQAAEAFSGLREFLSGDMGVKVDVKLDATDEPVSSKANGIQCDAGAIIDDIRHELDTLVWHGQAMTKAEAVRGVSAAEASVAMAHAAAEIALLLRQLRSRVGEIYDCVEEAEKATREAQELAR